MNNLVTDSESLRLLMDFMAIPGRSDEETAGADFIRTQLAAAGIPADELRTDDRSRSCGRFKKKRVGLARGISRNRWRERYRHRAARNCRFGEEKNGWHGQITKGCRIDTSNVGLIQGGEATDFVTDHVRVEAPRSRAEIP